MSSDFEIDLHNLDTECQEYPGLMKKYGDAFVEAKADHRKAELEYSEFKHNAEKRIRTRPDKFKIVKLTEGAVGNAMRSMPEYIATRDNVNLCQETVDQAESNLAAMKAKRDMLSDLVKLHGQQYFSDVPLTKKGVEEVTKNKTRRSGGVRQ